MPWAQWAITRGLKTFEKTVSRTKGKYCIGDTLTLADCFLPAQVYNAQRFNVQTDQFPNIMAIMAELEKI